MYSSFIHTATLIAIRQAGPGVGEPRQVRLMLNTRSDAVTEAHLFAGANGAWVLAVF